MKFKIIKDLAEIPQTLVIPLFSDNLEKDLGSIARKYGLDKDLLLKDFTGDSRESLLVYTREKGMGLRIFLVGLGATGKSGGFKWMKDFFVKHTKILRSESVVDLTKIPANKAKRVLQYVIEGATIGQYDLGLYKTSDKKKGNLSFSLLVRNEQLGQEIDRSRILAETKVRIMDLVNASSNKLTPEALGDWAIDSGRTYGYDVKVFGKKEITDLGLNALLAVNQGSDRPPTFIVAEYRPKKAVKRIGIVGKGVTFDTGGISIKSSANMHYMKSDMGGAAATLGSIEAAARLKLPIEVVAIVPATENAVDARALKPGDIIHSYSGKTIEVIDTDAEGRLILADALSYITKKYSPDVLIDFATLTGSVVATLGYHAAGLFSSDQSLVKQLLAAGDDCGERLWSLPLWEDYEEDLESDVADVKNYSGKPIAGAITAAKFLEVFTRDHAHWAHIDIAGTAFADSPLGKQKHATGYGVKLMISFLETIVRGK